MSELPDLLYGFYGTDFIIGGHNGNENRLVRNRLTQPVDAYQAIPIHGKISHLTTLFLQGFAAVQDRFVFSHASYDVIALVAVRLGDSFNSQVVGLRRTAGKDNLPRRGCMDQSCDLLSR